MTARWHILADAPAIALDDWRRSWRRVFGLEYEFGHAIADFGVAELGRGVAGPLAAADSGFAMGSRRSGSR